MPCVDRVYFTEGGEVAEWWNSTLYPLTLFDRYGNIVFELTAEDAKLLYSFLGDHV